MVASNGMVACQRVMSDKPFGKAGWLHKTLAFDASRVHRFTQTEVKIDAEAIHNTYRAVITEQEVETLASSTSLATSALVQLEVGRAREWPAGTYSFPMRDHNGKVIGIRLRNLVGKKWAVYGSKSGLFYDTQLAVPDTVWCVEGPTSTAALLSIGLYGLGRPSNSGGRDHVAAWMRRVHPSRVVVISEADGKDDCLFCEDNMCQHCHPGEWGAYTIAATINEIVPEVLVIHPMIGKDVRDWIKGGATKQTLLEMIQ